MKKFFLLVLIVILIGLLDFYILRFVLFEREVVRQNQTPFLNLLEERKPETSTIKLFAVGDIMLNRGVEFKIKKEGKGDFRFPFLKIADYLEKADILFGNLESIISDKGRKVGSIYSFRAQPQAIDGLTFAGFDVLSVANNHIFDYGREAMEDSFKRLKTAGIDYVGGGFSEKEAFSVRIKEIKGTKIGFLAYTNLGPQLWMAKGANSGIALIKEKDIEKVKEDIKKAKKKADILIVSLHAGKEYSSKPTPFQVLFSQVCIEAGADLVVGHHAHVIQPVEKYKSGWIAYGLGNFVFDQSFSDKTMKGLLLEVIIKNKKIKRVIPREIKISNNFQPTL